MLCVFGHHVARGCDMLPVENWTSAHALAQHCCTNLAKRLQHHATSTNIAWKIWPVSNLSQQHPTCRNTSQHCGQTRATCCSQHCCDMLRWNVVIVWPGLKGYFALSPRSPLWKGSLLPQVQNPRKPNTSSAHQHSHNLYCLWMILNTVNLRVSAPSPPKISATSE